MIRLQNVTMRYPVPKRYREYLLHPFKKEMFVALQDVTLRLERGECIGLLGPNGAGKTTLLKLIGGLLYPSEGNVKVNGYDTIQHNAIARQAVGYVINEERSFYWRLTGIQNLEFFGALENLFGMALKKRIEELLELVGLKDAGNKRVSDYSSGMRQRLAIARGMLTDPAVLLLDEPTKSLDLVGAEHLRRLILEDIHTGSEKSLVIATHQIGEAKMLCDRICVMKMAHLITERKTEDMDINGMEEFYRVEVEKPLDADAE